MNNGIKARLEQIERRVVSQENYTVLAFCRWSQTDEEINAEVERLFLEKYGDSIDEVMGRGHRVNAIVFVAQKASTGS